MATRKSKVKPEVKAKPASLVFIPLIVVPSVDITTCVVVKAVRGGQETFAAFAGSSRWSYVKLYQVASNALGADITKLGGFHFRIDLDGESRSLVTFGGDPKTGSDVSRIGQLILSKHFGLVRESRQ